MGPLAWTLDMVADATGGVLHGDAATPILSISTDSRDVAPGSLFVAVRGERHDGHDFAPHALQDGADAVVVEHGTPAGLEPRIEVEDTLAALRDLAICRRRELEMPVIAVTGSVGKTSTKDLLAAAIPGSWASPRSYNNEIGVPLTVLSTPGDATALVLEVGARGIGHIRSLMPAIMPSVSIITKIGVAHIEMFGSREAIAAGKWELVEGLPEGGTAVLPTDEPLLRREHPGPTITFGDGPTALVRVCGLMTDDEGRPSFALQSCGRSHSVTLAMAGAHNARNAAAAFAAATAIGMDPEVVVAGMSGAVGSPWRMEVCTGRFTVVNDAYNASPAAMEAALRTVAAMPGRSYAILGEMAELGSITLDQHRTMGRLAASLGFEDVVTVGRDHGLAVAAGGANVPSASEAYDRIIARIADGDVVLVKASRVVGLETLAEALTEEATS